MIHNTEFAERRSELADRINDLELDALLVSSRESIYYLTGASYVPEERPFFILIHPEKNPVFIVPKLEAAHMEKSGIGTVKFYTEFPAPKGEGWMDVISQCLGDLKNLGVEPSLPSGSLKQFKDYSPTLVPVIDEMRRIKSMGEIQMISQTAAYADIGMKEIIGASYAGATVVEIFSRSKSVQARVIKETDYDPIESAFLMASWPAPFSAQPHGIPTPADRMGKGPLVALSYLRVNGYAAEVERTYFHIPPSPDEKETYHHMLQARAMAVSMIRPGASCHEIDDTAHGYLVSRGYENYLLHRTGHGIGLGNHEGPFVARGSKDILEENMVISIEPGIYIPEIGGFRHSDTYLVTKTGCRALTSYPEDLESLTILAKKPLRRLMGKVICHTLGIK